MTIKKILRYTTLLLALLSLSACSLIKLGQKEEKTSSAKQIKPQNEEWRLAFNQIGLGDIANEGKGGASLADLKNLFGEPESHTTRPGGDVTLDVFSWRKGETTLIAQLYQDSTIAKSISNFTFIRPASVGLKEYEELNSDTTFTTATSLLGEPDVMSQAKSSTGEVITAIWSSGLKSNRTDASISLEFKDSKLSNKNQIGLEK